MPYLIAGLILALLVAFLSTILVQILAYVAAAVTIPFLLVMSLIRAVGLTDPGWYVVLHATLGAVVGATIHRWHVSSGWYGVLAGPLVAPFTASRWLMEKLFPGRSQVQEAVGGFLGLAIVVFFVLPLLLDAIAWTFGFLPAGGPFQCRWC